MAALLIASNAEASLQGQRHGDRFNGVYDVSITDEEVSCFLDKMKKAVQTEDGTQFSQLIHYPCSVFLPSKLVLKTPEEFKANAPIILTPKMKNLILTTKSEDIFVNAQGFMMGDGAIWFDPRLGILSFNVI